MTRRVFIACSILLLGCASGGADGPVSETARDVAETDDMPSVVEPPTLVSIVPIATAEQIPRDCSNPVEESCNAIDDDCDGVIDDGCGYGGGLMQVTASWDTGADIDLYVTGPLGDTLSFQRTSTPLVRVSIIRGVATARATCPTLRSKTFVGSALDRWTESTKSRCTTGVSA